MKIDKFRLEHQYQHRVKQDFEDLLNRPTERQLRPCRDCTTPCNCFKRSTTCCCSCNMNCPQAPRHLSSEGDRFPIEPAVAPLVYALNTLKLIQPCWSCEGHTNAAGQVVKRPTVWFYAVSSEVAALISEHLFSLQIKKALSAKWEVLINQIAGYGVVYQLQPQDPTGGVELHKLQADLSIIAKDLPQKVNRLAALQLDKIG